MPIPAPFDAADHAKSLADHNCSPSLFPFDVVKEYEASLWLALLNFGYAFSMIRLCFGTIFRLFCACRALLLENLALRQQLAVFKHRHPRPRLGVFDKLFWVTARRIWSDWKNSLIVVTPETVVGWHRAGFHTKFLGKMELRNDRIHPIRLQQRVGWTSAQGLACRVGS